MAYCCDLFSVFLRCIEPQHSEGMCVVNVGSSETAFSSHKYLPRREVEETLLHVRKLWEVNGVETEAGTVILLFPKPAFSLCVIQNDCNGEDA